MFWAECPTCGNVFNCNPRIVKGACPYCRTRYNVIKNDVGRWELMDRRDYNEKYGKEEK